MPGKIRSYYDYVHGELVLVNVYAAAPARAALSWVEINARPKCYMARLGMWEDGRMTPAQDREES